MLRDNLAGLIEPRLSSAGAHNLGGHPKRDKLGDAPGQPSWRSSLLNDPSAKFFAANPGDGQKNKWPGLKVTTPAHDSRAVRTAHHKSHRTIDPQCLENPRPEGAESTLTKNAASPFPAEPRQKLCHHCRCGSDRVLWVLKTPCTCKYNGLTMGYPTLAETTSADLENLRRLSPSQIDVW